MNLRKPLQGFLLFAALLFISTQTTYAQGGFPVRPGRILISPSIAYFNATTQWDSLGVKKPFANNGKYTSEAVTLFSEYGISRRFAFVATLPYVFNNYTQTGGPNTSSSGLTDL